MTIFAWRFFRGLETRAGFAGIGRSGAAPWDRSGLPVVFIPGVVHARYRSPASEAQSGGSGHRRQGFRGRAGDCTNKSSAAADDSSMSRSSWSSWAAPSPPASRCIAGRSSTAWAARAGRSAGALPERGTARSLFSPAEVTKAALFQGGVETVLGQRSAERETAIEAYVEGIGENGRAAPVFGAGCRRSHPVGPHGRPIQKSCAGSPTSSRARVPCGRLAGFAAVAQGGSAGSGSHRRWPRRRDAPRSGGTD